MALVYLLTNLENGKLYVGKTKSTLDARWYNHIKDAKYGSKYAIHRAIRKYGKDSFSKRVLGEYTTEEEALKAEQFWIEKLQTIGERGYNMCQGGRGATGYRHTPEMRARLSAEAIAKGQTLSALAIQRSAEVRSAGLSDKAKANLKAGQLVRRSTQPITEEFLENCRRAQSERRRLDVGIRPKITDAHKAALIEGRRKVGWHPKPPTDEFRAKMVVVNRANADRREKVKPVCLICGIDQTAKNTGPSSSRNTGLSRKCRACNREYMRAWKANRKRLQDDSLAKNDG